MVNIRSLMPQCQRVGLGSGIRKGGRVERSGDKDIRPVC